MSSPALKESVVRGGLWAGLERWLGQILSFAIYAVLARLVGPASFGLIALAGIYVAFIGVFANMGFGTFLVQRKELDGRHLDSAFWVSLLMATALAAGSIVLSSQLAVLLGEPQLAEVLRWLSWVLVLNSLSAIPQAVLIRSMSFRALAIRSLSGIFIGGAVGLAMAWGGLGVWSLVAQQLSNAIVGTAVLWWTTSWRPSFQISRRHLRDLFGFSISILGNEILWVGAQRVDQILIGFYFGASALGSYAIATRIVYLLKDLLTEPLNAVALPAFSMLQDERERLRNAFYNMTEVLAVIAVPAFCGLAALAPSFVPAIFGPQWSTSIPLFQILALYGLACVPQSFGHALMMAKGRPGVYLLMFISLVSLTLGFCFLATRWSLVAVAYAMSLAMMVHGVVFLSVLRKLGGISIRRLMFRLWAPAAISLVMSGVVVAFQSWAGEEFGALTTTIVGASLGAGIYCAGMAVLRPDLIRQLVKDLKLHVPWIAA